jgi:pyruvate formate lyase activating enzyme
MKEADLYEKEDRNRVRCLACAHKCLIRNNKTGICGIRKNVKGKLFLLVYSWPVSVAIDPIEKKPLYHFLTGTKTCSFGTIGCNFKCDFCQNFDISQAPKYGKFFGREYSPETIVEEAITFECKSIAYTYNEPTIFIEYVKDIAKLAKEKGLKNVFVTNGYMSKECFDYISDYIDAMNIDLKSFSDNFYKKICGARLKPVLDTIKRAHEKNIHIEITTLLIPGENDSEKELIKIAKFIASIDKKIPWHISRFFPVHKMSNKQITPIQSLTKAQKIGFKAGLKHVHIGNI